jgi:hypothetical protein
MFVVKFGKRVLYRDLDRSRDSCADRDLSSGSKSYELPSAVVWFWL